ncbi:MAG: VCBS repeat-containing protein, partial [Lentisphaeria bacterium]|nr:VCBS repeat-containing protein [Lentisphaeria bacterium]
SRISEIKYTGNEGESLDTHSSVEFEYEDRPDPSLRFFMGAKMVQSNRLAKITMKHNDAYMHDYRLTYTNSVAGQSLLVSIQQFFGEDSLPETRFEYSGLSAGACFEYTEGSDAFPGNSLTNRITLPEGQDRCLQGDFNGDGLMDVCSVGSICSRGNRWVGLSNGDGTFAFTDGTSFLPANLESYTFADNSANDEGVDGCAVQVADFNGDGRDDLCSVGREEDECWLGLSNGDGTFDFSSGTNIPTAWTGDYGCAVQVSDFNGDGLPDLCSVGPDGDECWVGLANTNGGAFAFDFTSNILESGLDAWAGDEGCLVLTGDFDGNGLADIFCVGMDAYNYGETRWVGLSNGDGTFDFTSGSDMLQSGLKAQNLYSELVGGSMNYSSGCDVKTGDFNGDGLTDVCSLGYRPYGNNCWVGLSDGDGTFTYTSGTNFLPAALEAWTGCEGDASMVFARDFNNDGLTDLCSVGPISSMCWLGLSRGDGTFDFSGRTGVDLLSSGLTADRPLITAQAGDFNGDGLMDICGMGSRSGTLGDGADNRWVGLSKGDGTFTFNYTTGSVFETASDIHYYSTADLNGDGLPDVFGVPCGDMHDDIHSWVGMNTNAATRLTRVVQGYRSESEHGVSTEIEYLPLTDTNIYVKGSGAEWPVRDVIPSMFVVSTLWKDNGQGGTYATDYTYRSA